MTGLPAMEEIMAQIAEHLKPVIDNGAMGNVHHYNRAWEKIEKWHEEEMKKAEIRARIAFSGIETRGGTSQQKAAAAMEIMERYDATADPWPLVRELGNALRNLYALCLVPPKVRSLITENPTAKERPEEEPDELWYDAKELATKAEVILGDLIARATAALKRREGVERYDLMAESRAGGREGSR